MVTTSTPSRIQGAAANPATATASPATTPRRTARPAPTRMVRMRSGPRGAGRDGDRSTSRSMRAPELGIGRAPGDRAGGLGARHRVVDRGGLLLGHVAQHLHHQRVVGAGRALPRDPVRVHGVHLPAQVVLDGRLGRGVEHVDEGVGEGARVRVAIVGVRRQRAEDDGVQVLGQPLVDRGGGHHLPLARLDERVDVDGALERLLLGEQLVEDDAGREDVDPVVPGTVQRGLLGRHVPELPHQHPLLVVGEAGGGARDAEVEQLHLALPGDEGVVGRDVAVDDPQRVALAVGPLVGVLEPLQELQDHEDGLLRGDGGPARAKDTIMSFRETPFTSSMEMKYVPSMEPHS